MITYTLQSYDRNLAVETNDICYRCKRCVQRDQDKMCIWHKSKGKILPDNCIVSNRINEKDHHNYETTNETGSYKILRCRYFVPDEQEDFEPMSDEEYEKICKELPDIMYHQICSMRDKLYATSEKYNNLEIEFKKYRDIHEKGEKNED